MEVLGVVASVAGLVSLAIEIPKLIETAVSIWSAPQEAKALSGTTDALIMTLRKLEAFLKTDEASKMHLASDAALIVSVSACQKRLLDISKKLRVESTPTPSGSTSRVKNVVCRFRWPFDKQECLALIQELHAMQSTFEFCLVLNNCKQMAKSHTEVIDNFKSQGDTLREMASSFPDQVAQLNSMMGKLQVIESNIRQAASDIDQVKIGLAELQEMQRDLATYHADKMHGQALEWLSPIDPSCTQDEIRATRHAGTCEWILASSEFQKWTQTAPSDDYDGVSCWVGDPGQGKTYTMSYVVDYLRDNLCRDAPGIFLTYLYCDFQKTRSYSSTSLIGALLRQLLSEFDSLPDAFGRLVYDACVKFRRKSARRDEMDRTLDIIQPHVKRLFICIDALDECTDADDLVTACRDIPVETSLFFIGRQSIARLVKRTFPHTPVQAMESQDADIDAVVSWRIDRERRRQPEIMPDGLDDEIRQCILELANGMFLLASLHTTLVLSHDTVYRRREALTKLPKTLEGAFGQTLLRIREHNQADQAFKILAWLHLVGPLPLDALRDILAIEPHHTQFQSDNIPSPHATLDYCLGLAKSDAPQGEVDNLTQVALVHSTLDMYLEANVELLTDAITALVEACFTYLSFDCVHRPSRILSLINNSWVRFLYALKSPPERLLETAWMQCIAFTTRHGNESSTRWTRPPRKRATPVMPKRAQGLFPASETPLPGGRNIFHAVCMLGLDGLDWILDRLSAHARDLGVSTSSKSINCIDSLGVAPLGWALLSENHFVEYPELRPGSSVLDSFHHNIERAERLITRFPFIDAGQVLWDMRALDLIREHGSTPITHTSHQTVRYLSGYLILFLLSNYEAFPDAIQRCISAVKTSLHFDPWSFDDTGTSLLSSVPTQLWWTVVACKSPKRKQVVFSPDFIDMGFNSVDTLKDDLPYDVPGLTYDELRASDGPGPRPLFAALSKRGTDAAVVAFSSHWNQENVEDYSRGSHSVSARLSATFRWLACWTTDISQSVLLHVVAAADCVDMLTLFTSQLDINGRDHNGQTPLHVALGYASSHAAKHLIFEPGIDLAIQDAHGISLLHRCAMAGEFDPADTILQRHPGLVNLQDNDGKTALYYAVAGELVEMVFILLQHKADANIRDADGLSPLHLAIVLRNATICDMIMDPRPGVDFCITNLADARRLAIEAGAEFFMTLMRILRGRPRAILMNAQSPHPDSPDSLTTNPEIKMIQLFLASDDDSFNVRDVDFMINLAKTTATAAAFGTTAALIRQGDNPFLLLPDPCKLIMSALTSGAQYAALYLLRLFRGNLDFQALCGGRQSAVHLAVIYDAPHVLRWFLDRLTDTCVEDRFFELLKGAIGAPNSGGYTPLHLAIVHKRLSMLEMLLCSGLDIGINKVGSVSGSTPLIMALTSRFPEAVTLLLAYGNNTHGGRLDLNHLDGTGRAALHYAVLQQDRDAVAQLLRCYPRLDPALPSGDGRTALAYAALSCDRWVVQMLLRTGWFFLEQRDSYGKTPADWARCSVVADMLRDSGNSELDKEDTYNLDLLFG